MWNGADTAQMVSAAERLRTVRRAQARFLALWAVDRLLDAPAAAERAWADADAVTPDNLAEHFVLQRALFTRRHLDD